MLYIFDDYTLNHDLYELRYRGERIALEPQVFEVLSYLVQHRDRVISKHELLEHLWPDRHVSDKALVRCIQKARQAINDRRETPQRLQTLHGRGYRFTGMVRQGVPEPSGDTGLLVPLPFSTPALPPGNSPASPAAVSRATRPLLSGTLDGERKQVTVVVGALDNAVGLATHLGDEAMHQVMQAFLALVRQTVRRYEGTLTECRGNGFMALFGAPLAHEDHPRRAVGAALELARRVPEIHFEVPLATPLAVRLGLHTGWVVVGPIDEDPRTPYLAVNDVTQLAEYLQQCATPGVIVVSEVLARLVEHEVHLELWPLTHDPRPVALGRAYRIVAPRLQASPWMAARSYAQRPFVGRARELTFLHERLQQVEGGEGHVVGLVGEPGLGKSRLLYEFLRSLQHRPVTCLVGRCLSYGHTTPYLPVLDLVRQYCVVTEVESPETIAQKLCQRLQGDQIDPDLWAPYLLHLLGVNTHSKRLAELSPEMLKTRTFEALWQMSLASSHHQPLILAVEDAHWIDPTSEECLASLVKRLAGAPILCLFTYRSGYRPPWIEQSYATQLALSRLTLDDSMRVVQAISGVDQLPDAVAQTILAKAHGNPFFLEELSRAMVEQGRRHEPVVVPETIQTVLTARIDRLPLEAKRLLQAAAVISREVSLPLLQAITDWPAETLDSALRDLQAAEFLYETSLLPERVHTFKHALTQEVAYQSLLQRTRQYYHARIAHILVERFPDTVATQPELVAHHYTQAGLGAQAIPYWQQAGQRAIARSASAEAISHLTRGITTLQTLPVTPERTQQELLLQITLGSPLRKLKGETALEVEDVYTRALELYQHVEDSPQRFEALAGLWNFALNRSWFRMTHKLAEQGLALAQRLHDPELLQEAYMLLGITLYSDGALVSARAHLEHSMDLYDLQKLRTSAFRRMAYPEVMSLVYMARIVWVLGYPDQALVHMQRAITLAQERSHTYSIGWVLHMAGTFHQYRHEVQLVHTYAEAGIAFARERGFARWQAGGLMRRGWALAQQGAVREGIVQLREGLARWQTLEGEQGLPFYLASLAEVYGKAGQPEAGLQVLAEAQAAAHRQIYRRYEAELLCLQGELLLQRGAQRPASEDATRRSVSLPPYAAEAETCFRQAIEVAHQQQAKSLELRAAMSLSCLWYSQGKCADARQLLGERYHWFTEGFETPDLRQAKALLDAWA